MNEPSDNVDPKLEEFEKLSLESKLLQSQLQHLSTIFFNLDLNDAPAEELDAVDVERDRVRALCREVGERMQSFTW